MATGSNQSCPEKRAEERLVTTVMAPWNVTLHVRPLASLVHSLGLCVLDYLSLSARLLPLNTCELVCPSHGRRTALT